MAIEKQMIDPNAKFVINASILTGHTLRWENGIIKIYNRFGMPDTAFRAADMPTVDAVEVVHGRWISKGRKIECSVCAHRGFLGTTDPVIHKEEKSIRKYCHNCGAKMDGDWNEK